MHHIVIDTRTINSPNGEGIGQFLNQLQVVDKTNKYTILFSNTDKNHWKPTENNFNIKSINFKNSFFNDQFRLKKILDNLSPDLVHFYTPKQPILYKGRHITTLYNLNDMPGLSPLKTSYFSWFKKYIFNKIISSNKYIIVSSSYIKKELLKIINTPVDTVAVIPFAVGVPSKTSVNFWHQTALQIHSVYIDAIRDHFKV